MLFPQYSPQQPPAPAPQARYSTPQGQMGSYGQPIHTAQHQNWQQPPAFNGQAPPSPYQGQSVPAQAQVNTGYMINGVPYAFGQLPVHVNPNDPKSQHPIPGSYNRHAFNPSTKSFVPGNGMSPVQSVLTPYNIGPAQGSPQIGRAHLSYGTYGSPSQQSYMGGPGYGMSRQGSNNSLPPYHQSQHMPQHASAPLPQMPQSMPMKPSMPGQGMPPGVGHQGFAHLPNYGNSATLPQKPPSGI